MRPALVLVFLPAMMLASCAAGEDASEEESAVTPTPEKHPSVNALVDRFDVPPCLNAQLNSGAHREGDDGNFFVNTFTVEQPCVEAIVASVGTVRFDEVAEGSYSVELSDGTKENLIIERGEDQSEVIIKWETGR